jgi:outer membrane protein assembly factor BamA
MFLAMNRSAHYAFVLSASFGTLICATQIRAQTPRCEELHSSVASDSSKVKIDIESVEFAGVDELTAPERSKIAEELQKQELSAGMDEPRDLWVNELQQTKQLLQDQGYFRASLELTPHLIRAEENERHYALTVGVYRGPQYQLGEIRFENSRVFTAADLRKTINLQSGDLFDISKVQEAIKNIDTMYEAEGYIDETMEPIESIDENGKRVDVLFKVDEGMQYHIGTVELFGLNPSLQAALANILQTGRVFDTTSFFHLMEENKPLLPPAAEIDKSFRITRNTHEATTDVTIDFRKCSET